MRSEGGRGRKGAHLAECLADLWAGDKVAACAKDGMRRFKVVAVDGVGEGELHVGRKVERAGCLWRVSESEGRSGEADLEAVRHELLDLGRAMATRSRVQCPEPSQQSSHSESDVRVQIGFA